MFGNRQNMYRFLWTLMSIHGINSCQDFCLSQIYCQGELLDDIQMAKIYTDSKTFVDKKLKYDENIILQAYSTLKANNNGQLDKVQLLAFVNEYFEDDNLVEWTPKDFNENPEIANKVKDENYRKFVLAINDLWKILARKVNEDVCQNPSHHSALYLPNGFIIPGSRFLEVYYWDTFWIVKGALICGMVETVKGIIENIFYIVREYGYMLNGTRKYYMGRSQPPFLSSMVDAYYQHTKDFEFITNNIDVIEQELNFWIHNRTVVVEKNGKKYTMAIYNTTTCTPRPESYSEDKCLAETLPATADKTQLYSNLKTAAESGMDFSSKHFDICGNHKGTLLDTHPQNFLYVELNSMLQLNCKLVSNYFKMLNDMSKYEHYKCLADNFQAGINELLWNDHEGMWLDFDLRTKASRNQFYATNWFPLWTGSYDTSLSKFYGDKVVDYLIKYEIVNYENLCLNYYGIPFSFNKTDLQWDLSNCWPPMQGVAAFGLENTESIRAKEVASNIALSWVYTNYVGYQKYGHIFEKYNSNDVGVPGKGGEYTAQTGFGWSNGILLQFFNYYGNVLKSDVTCNKCDKH